MTAIHADLVGLGVLVRIGAAPARADDGRLVLGVSLGAREVLVLLTRQFRR
jgi:hypothetical protein